MHWCQVNLTPAGVSVPEKFTPGSEMPACKFVDRDLMLITDYLLAIPK